MKEDTMTAPTVTAQLRALRGLSTSQLRTKYREIFGEDTFSHNRDFLFKRIAWRLQEQAFGGLSQRTTTRLAALVDESLIRVRPPQTFQPGTDVGPMPTPQPATPPTGKIITRVYKGRRLEVEVLEQGFRYNGAVYASLSAVAKAITGTHCNGRSFFGLTGKEQG